MRRYLRTTRIFWGASIAAELEYRVNFVMSVIASLMTLTGTLFTLSVLYQHNYQMGGWTWPQAMVVVSVYTILDGFQMSLLAPNRTRITELVREGTLDFVLLKPIDSQYWLSTRTLSLWGVPNMLLGLAMLVYVGTTTELHLGPTDYLAGLIPIILGMVVLYSVGYILSTLTIWFVKLFNITIAMQALLEAGRYPISGYPFMYRLFFTFVLPVAFMTTVPAQSIIGKQSAAWLIGSVLISVVLFLISRRFWRFALQYYTSASS